MKFSSLIRQGKVSDELLLKARENGIDFDLSTDSSHPDIVMDILDDVDIDAEMKKAEACVFWPDKDEFLSQFNFKDINRLYLPRLQDLLWSFRHIFYNEKTPDQFQTHLRIRPIKIDLLPGACPRREKMRTMSPKKLEHLKTHIETLLRQGVIAELDDATDCHVSPVHIVVERDLSPLPSPSWRNHV